MMKYLQKLGKSLMLPVACLPVAAILMGIGYWIDPTGWGANNVAAAFLIKAGGALIDNMAILFAIGVGVGMSDDNDGTAGLAGLVSWLMITTLLSTGVVAMLKGVDVSEVPAAFGKIQTQFIGILSGVILAIGRVVGETAALIYTAGTLADVPKNLMSSGRTLAVHMYALLSEGLYMEQAYATAVILLIMVIIINALSGILAKKVGVKND